MMAYTPNPTWVDNVSTLTAAKLQKYEDAHTAADTALAGKAATTHTHGVTDLTWTPDAASSAGGTTTVDAATSYGPSRALSLTGNITVNGLTNVTDQRRLLVEFYASGATRTVNFASPVVNGSTATFPLSVPSGKCALVGFYYSTRLGYAVIVSAAVMP